MICDSGDVVLVPFPFVDIPIGKKRPALVLSRRSFNTDHQQTLLAMITTSARSRWPSDIDIEDLAPTGLAHDSIIRWKVFTLPNAIFMRRLGQLGLTDMQRLTTELRQILPAV